MRDNIPISKSVFSKEFENVNSEKIFLLAKNNALDVWQKYIDEKASSYFNLPDDNWLIKSRQTVVGHWLADFNDNDVQRVGDILDSYILWDDDDIIWFCISKYFVLEAKWHFFKSFWINFLECEDDCPILINREKERCAILFSSIGNITKVQAIEIS